MVHKVQDKRGVTTPEEPGESSTHEVHEIQRTLAKNLKRWMHETPRLETQMKLHAESGLSQTTIGRILNCQLIPTIARVERLASCFGRTSAELLQSNSGAIINYDAKRYGKLPDYEKARIEAFIKHVIEQYAQPTASTPPLEEMADTVIKATQKRTPKRAPRTVTTAKAPKKNRAS